MVIHKETMRTANERSVLQRIFTESPISKSQIARDVKLNKVTVSQIVNRFIESGLVVEAGAGDSTQQGGRKPNLLQINARYGYVVCIDLGYHELSALAMTISGQKLEIRRINFTDNDISSAISKIKGLIAELKTEYGEKNLGILISVHGIVYQNQVIYSPFWNMHDVDIAAVLTESLGITVLLENEANLTAIFERDFSSEGIRNAVSISMHKGIGAGIIMDGELYRGRKGEAGEIGQTIAFETKDKSLAESQKIEDVASQEAVLDQIKQAKNLDYINLLLIRQMYDDHDPVTLEILQRFENNIIKLINNVIVSFDPDVLFINAYIFKEFPELLERIRTKFAKISVRDTPIVLSRNVETASLYGGCAQMIQEILGFSKLKLDFKSKE
ncbi:ROK family transcriptional regulator [Pediococcus acidilactici]|uniref:ROK family transcriptional regulator n=1 Tax=Pediococcus acidilactici TaxID=1254 RepID=UPI000E5D2969|nr:ROK family transcriptional regulator [Pediococcus acidilactici]KAF0515916.1 ROK family protein [Pediococcus acidilactici]MBW9300766.1 ROK family transcriptional regulator [Pediococcus acidilactici]MCT3037418.1 ROK family transcriptional regulator [Pediococcus acidilactici]QQC45582.1 ROK family transcriptional regulator [Pediococcus acidilactici]RJF53654.1 ROK family transcriptional regulator [Pediococcus acidilactici]